MLSEEILMKLPLTLFSINRREAACEESFLDRPTITFIFTAKIDIKMPSQRKEEKFAP